MKTRFLLLALVCSQTLAQQSPPAAPGPEVPTRAACTAGNQGQPDKDCAAQADMRLALADPNKLLATEPTAAGPRPLTRRQVVAEIERARRAGEMDFAASEVNLDSPRRR